MGLFFILSNAADYAVDFFDDIQYHVICNNKQEIQMKQIAIEGYLTEQKLGDVLKTIFGDAVHPQCRLRDEVNKKTFIVDYAVILPNDTLLVEFNGPMHYTKHKTIYRDLLLEEYSHNADKSYRLVEIPYFLQLKNNEMFSFLFGDDIFDSYVKDKFNVTCDFPHGFVSNPVVRPESFTYAGWCRFVNEYRSLFNEVISSEVIRAVYDTTVNHDDFMSFVYLSEQLLSPDEFHKHYPT